MRKILSLILAVVLAAGVSGCGGAEKAAVTETTIEVKKNGQVVQTIVEDFAESYYDLESMKAQIEEACEEYNAKSGAQSVSLTQAQAEDGTANVVLTYAGTSEYAGFNNLALFAGTVKEAYNAGYDLNVSLISAKGDGEQIGKSELLAMGEKHIVIIREAVNVKVWDSVLYYTDDVEATDSKKTVRVTDGDMLTYIIFE